MGTILKNLRLHVALFGRTNVNKFNSLNAITRQYTSTFSGELGTITDVVEKIAQMSGRAA